MRSKKMPPLRRLMSRLKKKRRRQSWEEQLSVVKMLNAFYGGSKE